MHRRAGKQARKLSEYRARMRTAAQGTDPTKGAMAASLYHGSKCEKGPGERRPAKGGRVRPA